MALAMALSADVPQLINYQGRLSDAEGKRVTGVKSMSFAFYDSSSGGNLLGEFRETRNVTVTDGIFNVLLGSATSGGIPAGVFESTYVYLSVKVDGVELTPRQRVGTVAFAMKTADADHALSADVATRATVADQLSSGLNYDLRAYIPDLIGHDQGRIEGQDCRGGPNPCNVISVRRFGHTIDQQVDPLTGAVGERRRHHAVTVLIGVGKPTPALYQALLSREELSVTIRFDGLMYDETIVPYFTIVLDNAIVASIRNMGLSEEVSFSYEGITWVDELNDRQATDHR